MAMQVQEQSSYEQGDAGTAQRTDPRQLAGRAVLLVDDEAALRLVLGGALSRAGHTVDTAADGFEALVCLTDRTYDVIVTDIQMPRMDGISFLESARELGYQGAWVLMTGSPALLTASTLPILQKPFRLCELRDLVQRVERPDVQVGRYLGQPSINSNRE